MSLCIQTSSLQQLCMGKFQNRRFLPPVRKPGVIQTWNSRNKRVEGTPTSLQTLFGCLYLPALMLPSPLHSPFWFHSTWNGTQLLIFQKLWSILLSLDSLRPPFPWSWHPVSLISVTFELFSRPEMPTSEHLPAPDLAAFCHDLSDACDNISRSGSSKFGGSSGLASPLSKILYVNTQYAPRNWTQNIRQAQRTCKPEVVYWYWVKYISKSEMLTNEK